MVVGKQLQERGDGLFAPNSAKRINRPGAHDVFRPLLDAREKRVDGLERSQASECLSRRAARLKILGFEKPNQGSHGTRVTQFPELPCRPRSVHRVS